MSEFEVLDPLPGYGGKRTGAGRKRGYSPKKAAAIDSGVEQSDPSDQTSVAVRFAQARARKETALADLNELSFKVKSGEFVSRDAVRQGAATVLAALAQSLRSLPDTLERKHSLAPEVIQMVEIEIDAALLDASSELQRLSEDASEAEQIEAMFS